MANDIRVEFPSSTGYSVRNLKYMAKFARLFPDFEFVQVPLAQITWYHHISLMDKIKELPQYLWYLEKTVQNGWTRNILVHQIETDLYHRQAVTQKVSNFSTSLPEPQSELALQTFKDPY